MLRFLSPDLTRKCFPALLILALAGCVAQTLPASSTTASPSPSASVILRSLTPSRTATRTQTFTSTSTIRPTATSWRPTRTPSATFDINHNPTLTPAIPATCPAFAAGSAPAFVPAPISDPNTGEVFMGVQAIDSILPYANAYGLEHLYRELARMAEDYPGPLAYMDLTNDGVPELLLPVSGMEMYPGIYILGCQEGEIQVLFELRGIMGFCGPDYVKNIVDGNLNGIPELLINTNCRSKGGQDYQLYEWDGEQFRSLLLRTLEHDPVRESIFIGVHGEVSFSDMDGDGLLEVISNTGNFPVYDYEISSREVICTFNWNGENYIAGLNRYGAPEYRFQAAQDGDLYTLQGRYDQALEMYGHVIYSDTLDWWSRERQEYLINKFYGEDQDIQLTPDPLEYPSLSAYAYYRIMLLYTLQNLDAEAQAIYQSLQSRYPEGEPGHTYAEMASTFLNEYQSSGNLQLSCEQAVEYAGAHPHEILDYIGGDYMGVYSREYQTVDICLNWETLEIQDYNCNP